MWSSDAAEANSHSSSSSSSSVFPKRKTMEEVWKDISLIPTLGQDMSSRPSTPSLSLEAPLPHKSASASASASAARPSFRGMILQDFLAGAFKDPPPSANASSELGHPPLPPPTALSLSTSAALRHAFRPAPAPPTNSNSAAAASDRIPCPANSSAADLFFSANKLIGDDPSSCISAGDRRYKRMIKNRESAARSRARKQAYTNELELKVAHLTEENTKLKKQNEELRLAMAAQLPKRKALHRTSSAPF